MDNRSVAISPPSADGFVDYPASLPWSGRLAETYKRGDRNGPIQVIGLLRSTRSPWTDLSDRHAPICAIAMLRSG
jgi:hypothetical protein